MAQGTEHLELAHEVLDVVVGGVLVQDLRGELLPCLHVRHQLDLGKVAAAKRLNILENLPELAIRLETDGLHRPVQRKRTHPLFECSLR